MASFEAEHVDVLKEFTEREGIDCDFVITRSIDVHLDKELCSELKAGYDHLVRAGVRTAQKTHYIHEKAAEGVSALARILNVLRH